ncbi:hypothetical protein KJ891_01890 [Candidatus Micrarchaeota archaeon]|nr:hypothetical protein [Candidatus Micrarchaeota archaeon]
MRIPDLLSIIAFVVLVLTYHFVARPALPDYFKGFLEGVVLTGVLTYSAIKIDAFINEIRSNN